MRRLLSFSLFLSACAHSSLTAAQRTDLHTPVEQLGELVYSGTVTPLGSAAPVFRYERRVLDVTDGTRVVTHVTFEGAEPVVLQRAKLDGQGRLLAYDEVHAQRGEALHLDGGDVLVGPTLFEFVRMHLGALRAGREVPLDFWARGTPLSLHAPARRRRRRDARRERLRRACHRAHSHAGGHIRAGDGVPRSHSTARRRPRGRC